MGLSVDQIHLSNLIARTGLKDREIGRILDVSQPTAWRLRMGRIGKVSKYVRALEAYLGEPPRDQSGNDLRLVTDLVLIAGRVPALRQTLESLHRLMHENE